MALKWLSPSSKPGKIESVLYHFKTAYPRCLKNEPAGYSCDLSDAVALEESIRTLPEELIRPLTTSPLRQATPSSQ